MTNEFLNYSQYLTEGISDGDNLYGFKFDLVAYICDEKQCFHISHECTEDKNCMLVLHCRFSDHATSHEINEYLETNWMEYLRYSRGFEKHYCEKNSNGIMTFYFVTTLDTLGVTGKIVVH